MRDLLKNKFAVSLTVLLVAQALIFNLGSRAEVVPSIAPLAQFPWTVGGWTTFQDYPMDPEVAAQLRADDTVHRAYSGPDGVASLFIAFFKTQRSGQVPHSPKNCLPGAGWEPSETGTAVISVEGRSPIEVNRYIVARQDEKSLVLYWYQSRDRVVASELHAKMWNVADSIRYRRSDTSLVRILVPIRNNDVNAAMKTATRFVQVAYPEIRAHLPA
jgi:EpsI family protein